MKRFRPLLLGVALLAAPVTANSAEVVYRIEANPTLSEYYAIMGLSYAATLVGFKLDRAYAELETPSGYSSFTRTRPKTYDLKARSVQTELEAHDEGSKHSITMTWTIVETSPDRAAVRVETRTDDPNLDVNRLEDQLIAALDRELTRVTGGP